MNLKSYSRGIGAGLIVAALVLGLGAKPEKMSDAAVKKRASELGMIESQTLTDLTTSISDTTSTDKDVTVSDDKEDINSGTETSVSTQTSTGADETGTSTEDGKDTDVSDKTESDGPEFKEPDEETVPPIIPEEVTPPPINPLPDDEPGFTAGDQGVEIVVIRGDSSVSVARRMYEAELVESAVEFDRYLCENGYDKVICVGTYNIPYGLSFEEMARIITRR